MLLDIWSLQQQFFLFLFYHEKGRGLFLKKGKDMHQV